MSTHRESLPADQGAESINRSPANAAIGSRAEVALAPKKPLINYAGRGLAAPHVALRRVAYLLVCIPLALGPLAIILAALLDEGPYVQIWLISIGACLPLAWVFLDIYDKHARRTQCVLLSTLDDEHRGMNTLYRWNFFSAMFWCCTYVMLAIWRRVAEH